MIASRCTTLLLVLLLAVSAFAQGKSLPLVGLQACGLEEGLEERLAAIIDRGIERKWAPGAVCIVGRDRQIAIRMARGLRVVGDSPEAMDAGTIFDMASLTKCVATTTSILTLISDGRLQLDTRLRDVIPEADSHGKGDITIEQLLRHRGGLLPDNSLKDYLQGVETAHQRIYDLDLRFQPGTNYTYTDVGFILLGWVVERLTNQSLDAYAQERVFNPVGMGQTAFVREGTRPAGIPVERCAPTEPAKAGQPDLRGVVHDPRARALNGVAGHAGLFSTADDLARFASTLLNDGVTPEGARALPPGLLGMITARTDLAQRVDRSLGWDRRRSMRSKSSPRGRHFPSSGFGHTGFTGTSMWMDPTTKTFVIVLTSRLQGGKGNVLRMRHLVGTAVAESIRERPWPLRTEPLSTNVRAGIDRVMAGHFPADLKGKRIGLITNHTGRDRTGAATIDRLHESADVKLVQLFSPEHGIRGKQDSRVEDSTDEETGLEIISLYGKVRRPTPESLADLDALVFDIQDIGTRFYTYVSTMVNCMEAAQESGIPFVVLDRPNPINGTQVEGPIADDDALDFVGCLRVPVRHGMTVGELALLAQHERRLSVDLRVVWMTGWRRTQWWDQTGLKWVNPSPNMRSLKEAVLYPGIGLWEFTNLSVGRGTQTPFEVLGAPWLDAEALTEFLNSQDLPGVRVNQIAFTPDSSKFKDQLCHGVFFDITDREALRAVDLGMAIAWFLRSHHNDEWDTQRMGRLLKNKELHQRILAGYAWTELVDRYRRDHEAFLTKRASFLIYEP